MSNFGAFYEAAASLVPRTYVAQGRDARRSHERHIQLLLEQVGRDMMVTRG